MRRASLPSLFAALLLITSLAFAQEQKRGLDDPAHEDQLQQTQIAAVNMADSRRPVSIAPGGTFEFKQLEIIVLAIRAVNPTVGGSKGSRSGAATGGEQERSEVFHSKGPDANHTGDSGQACS
jgi:hypothetical protein